MLAVPLYYAILTLCSLYALLKGGCPERMGAALLVVGSIGSLAVRFESQHRYRSVETGILLVDVALLGAFTVLALRSDRFWPIWISALVGLTLLGHVGRWLASPPLGRGAYAISIIVWSYVALAVLAIGVFNHQRRIVRRGMKGATSGA